MRSGEVLRGRSQTYLSCHVAASYSRLLSNRHGDRIIRLGETDMILLLTLIAMAPETTPADVGRCVIAKARELSSSQESDETVADKAIGACSALIDQMVAARDALVTKETGSPPPPGNSAEWRKSAVSIQRHTALVTVRHARKGQ